MVMIFIEGLPCAGKSELIKVLEACDKSVCHELGRLFKRHEFPGNGKTLDEIKKIDHWFIEKEAERYRSDGKLFFDRSYFTHLCYAYAYGRLMNLPSFEQTVKRYHKNIDDHILPLPTYIIYIAASSELSIQRQRHKMDSGVSEGLPSFWRQTQFLDDTLKAYDVLFSSMDHIPVYSIDAALSTRRKIELLIHWLGENRTRESHLCEDRRLDLSSYIHFLKEEK